MINLEEAIFRRKIRDVLMELEITGIEHLTIIPHQGLHFVPFHLIGGLKKTLANDFKISYQPNLQILKLLRPKTARPAEVQISCIGLDFTEIDYLGSIPQATQESRIIAGLFDSWLFLNSEATHANVFMALRNSRYVHLATHGTMDTEAPNFHCLYLYCNNEYISKLYAYQILAMDLRNIELLTLSACETALGRFDREDNLRGLRASFFMAGVQTIVGTLWEVESSASELFFTTLYRQIKTGRGKLDSFQSAQQETRRNYPQFRDWGAFYYMGAWEGLVTGSNEYSIAGIPSIRFSHPLE